MQAVVLQEIVSSFPKLRKAACLCWSDFSPPSLFEFTGSVDEELMSVDVDLSLLTETDMSQPLVALSSFNPLIAPVGVPSL